MGLVFGFRFWVEVLGSICLGLGFGFCLRFRVLGHVTRTLRQSKYIVHLSIDQSKQTDSPNGKITPAVLLPLMPNRHFLVKFWK